MVIKNVFVCGSRLPHVAFLGGCVRGWMPPIGVYV